MNFLFPLALLLSLPAGQTSQTTRVPDLNVSVSFREKPEGSQLGRPVYILEVMCSDGECSYSYVSINDCGPLGSGGRAFYPKVTTGSTRNGDLKATNDGAVLTLEQTGADSIGNWTNTFRIGYEPAQPGAAATRVVSFSGGFLKTSDLIKRPTRIEYIPLEGPFQELNLDCSVIAPGVDPR